jgi:multisubunit Na+/H+ antiporter MnhB subunit
MERNMNRKIIVLLIVVPIIVGLLVTTPLIYNWQRNKEWVGQNIELTLIETANKIVDDMFIPIIYLAFVFSYCVTLSGIVSIYLIERKEKHKVKS